MRQTVHELLYLDMMISIHSGCVHQVSMRQTDNALPYFDMMIFETLRLCPPGEYETDRQCTAIL